ncbi:beta strand repeat-containing protein, partial [Flavobacterium sp. LB3P45]
MKTFLHKSQLLSIVFLLANLFFASVAFGQATVSTDLLDYPPGSTAIITGFGFQAGEKVILLVEHVGVEPAGTDPQYHQPWTIVADSIGNIATSWYVPTVAEGDALGATFLLTADGQNGAHAEWTFTDAANDVATVTVAASQTGTVTYGTSYNATYTVTITPNGTNGTGNTTLSLAGTTLPIGVNASFSTNPVALPSGSNVPIIVTLTIINAITTTAGTINGITVRTSGSPAKTSNNAAYVVNKRSLTVSAQTNTKAYDGTTSAVATPAITSGSLAGTDVANFIETYDTNNVGNNKTLTPSGTVSDGNSGNNYAYTFQTNTTGTINKASQTISWSTPAAITYGTVLSATQLNATAQGVLTYTPALGTLLDAGTSQVLSVSAAATANYEAAGPTTVLINVNRANQTITWVAPSAIIYGASLNVTQLNATVAGSATVGASVPGALVYSPISGTLLNAGNQLLQVDAAQTKNYNAASKQVTLVVNKANQTINWSNPADITYGTLLGATQLNATAQGILTYTPASGTLLNAGLNQTLSANAALTPNYNAAGPTTVQINVNKADQTITLSNLSQTYDGSPKSATAITSPIGGLNVLSITYNGSVTPPTSAGSYAVIASLNNANYQATNATGILVINKATPTFSNLSVNQIITYGNSSVSLSGTINGSTVPTGTITATINGAAHNTSRGTGSNTADFSVTYNTSELGAASSPYTITYSYPGDNNFNAINDATKTLTVNKATATISLSNLNHIYDGSAKSATGTTSPNGLTAVSITYDGSAIPPTNAGSYAVIASLNNANYQATNATGILLIAKATATLTLDVSTLNQTYDGSARVITATTNPSGLGAISVTYNGSPTPPTNAGSYTIVASLTNANYQVANATGTLLVSKATPTFSNLTASQNIIYGTASITLSGKITAGTLIPTGSVSVTVDGTGQTGSINSSDGTFSLLVNTSAITATAAPYSINYNYSATDNFNAKLDNSTALSVNKATATITLGSLSHTYDGIGKVATASTSPSGLNTVNISYSQSGSSVPFPTNVGSYDVTATLTNINYTASTTTGTLVINKAAPSFSAITASQSITYGTSTITLSGKISAGSSIPTGSIIISINGISSSVAIKQTGGSNVVGTFNLIFNTSSINASAVPYAIKYEYNGDNNFGLIQDISTAVTVNKATALIAITDYSGVYDAAAHTASGTATGVGSVNLSSGLSFATSYTNVLGGSTGWSFTGGTNYNDASGTAQVTIAKAPSVTTVTIAAGAPFIYTGSAISQASVSVTGAGGLSLTPTPVYANNINVGTANASYSYTGDANHEGSTDTKDFAIAKAPSVTTVTIAAGVPFTYTGSAISQASVSVTGAGGLSLTPTPVYTNNINVGTANASYSYTGDANHEGSTDTKDFAIAKAPSVTTVTIAAGAPFTYTG